MQRVTSGKRRKFRVEKSLAACWREVDGELATKGALGANLGDVHNWQAVDKRSTHGKQVLHVLDQSFICDNCNVRVPREPGASIVALSSPLCKNWGIARRQPSSNSNSQAKGGRIERPGFT